MTTDALPQNEHLLRLVRGHCPRQRSVDSSSVAGSSCVADRGLRRSPCRERRSSVGLRIKSHSFFVGHAEPRRVWVHKSFRKRSFSGCSTDQCSKARLISCNITGRRQRWLLTRRSSASWLRLLGSSNWPAPGAPRAARAPNFGRGFSA
jgi:hypothetical protein